MSDLHSLGRKIQQRLKSLEEKEQSQQIQLQARMADLEKRQLSFNQLASKYLETIINPRIEKLASFFDNANLFKHNKAGMHFCDCRFNHSDRFPASVKLSISVAHDTEIENLLFVYDLEILPVFFKFEEHNQAVFPLDDPDEQQIANWIEEIILMFVDTYLQIEKTDQYQRSTFVTDPVCGMKFRKSIASSKVEHSGHKYYFCSQGCYEKFINKPERYIEDYL